MRTSKIQNSHHGVQKWLMGSGKKFIKNSMSGELDASPNVVFVASLIKAAPQNGAATMSDSALLINPIPGGGAKMPALHIRAIFRSFQVGLEWYQKRM